MSLKNLIRQFVVPKARFAVTSAIATAADYIIYLVLTRHFNSEAWLAHGISYTLAMILNFILQHRYIFTARRPVKVIFLMSVAFSAGGWLLSQAMFNILILTSVFFNEHDIVAKLLVTAIVFFYNFYTKRFSFEKKMPLEGIRKIRPDKAESPTKQ
ncbi:MAG: hypothetical protein Kow00127_11390 [Bacteroidales bacterium]